MPTAPLLLAAFLASTPPAPREEGFVLLASTSAALDMARRGGVDLLLVHAKAQEEAFVGQGFGTARIPLMYNDFVLVGPPSDPAGVKAAAGIREALRTLASKGAPFITRGDGSGTHLAEQALWAQAGLAPSGAWYRTFAQGAAGNQAALLHTDAADAYTIIDRATYLTLKGRIRSRILLQGDAALLNHMSLIPVNPDRVPGVRARDAAALARWLTSPRGGRRIIQAFGGDAFGEPLFTPEPLPP